MIGIQIAEGSRDVRQAPAVVSKMPLECEGWAGLGTMLGNGLCLPNEGFLVACMANLKRTLDFSS
jgi:hypothetical protein